LQHWAERDPSFMQLLVTLFSAGLRRFPRQMLFRQSPNLNKQPSSPMPEVRLPSRLTLHRATKLQRTCPGHRAWVRRHQCSVANCRRRPIECAHVRRGTDGGVALKPSDRWCVSLCAFHHAEQHRLGERRFEAKYDLDLAALAIQFAVHSPYRSKIWQDG